MTKQIRAIKSMLSHIRENGLAVGDKLPSEPVQMSELGISKTTVRIAMKKLEEVGIIDRQRGSGTYLRKVPTDSIVKELFSDFKRMKPSFSTDYIKHHKNYTISFLCTDSALNQSRYDEGSIVFGVYKRASYDGHKVLIGPSRPPHAENQVVTSFSEHVFSSESDGLIILAYSVTDSEIETLNKLPVPYVLIDPSLSHNNCVSLDVHAFCSMGINNLKNSGCKSIAVLEQKFGYKSRQVLRNYTQEEGRFSGQEKVFYFGGNDTYSQMREYFGPKSLPDGIYINDDVYANDVYKKLISEGVKVGEDVKITCVASSANLNFIPDEIDCVCFDLEEVGNLAVQMLERLMNEEKEFLPPIKIGGILECGPRNNNQIFK